MKCVRKMRQFLYIFFVICYSGYSPTALADRHMRKVVDKNQLVNKRFKPQIEKNEIFLKSVVKKAILLTLFGSCVFGVGCYIAICYFIGRLSSKNTEYLKDDWQQGWVSSYLTKFLIQSKCWN